MSAAANRAVFLDRDGTIVEDVDYLTQPQQLRLLPGAPEALKLLAEAGFLLIVATNQSAIARGWLTEEGLEAVHAELRRLLEARGARIDAFYHCPHLRPGPARGSSHDPSGRLGGAQVAGAPGAAGRQRTRRQ
ncbi:MAG: D-glycero-alpha-D-manno-heptose-1,7-bisphosphate 7-phosphatase [Planctomycetota bacterium]